MAIFGGGGRMNAYGEPLVDSTVGEALGGLLGRGVSYLGNRFKDSLFDDKGLVRANPEGPGMPVLGKQKGFDDKTKEAYQDFRSKLYDDEGLFRANPEGPDKPVMGRYKGLDVLKGNKFLGEKEGFDKPYLGNLLGGVGSRLRTMFSKSPDEFTKAGGGTFNTELPAKSKGLFNKEERIAYNPQEAMSMLKKGLNIQDVSQEDLGSLQQLMKDEGYYEGEVDSILGPKTANAFNQMMQERGLLADEVETTPYRFTAGSPGRMY